MTPWISACTWWTDDQSNPSGSLLASSVRRRSSGLTRACADVLQRLSTSCPIELDRITTVYASAYGEIGTTTTLLQMMHDEHGGSSPTRFQASVHNTAAGTISISCGNRGLSTSVAAGWATVAAGVWEARGILEARHPQVVVIFADEAIPPPLTPRSSWGGLSVAIHLTAKPQGARPARLLEFRIDEIPPLTAVESPWTGNPCAPALELARRFAQGQAGPLGLETGVGRGWCCDLSFDDGRHGP